MKFKKRLAVLLSIIIFTCSVVYNPIEVKAAGIVDLLPSLISVIQATEQSSSYSNWYESFRPKYIQTLSEMFTAIGLPSKFGEIAGTTWAGDPIQNFRLWFESQYSGQTVTDDEAKQGLYQMFNNCVVNQSQGTLEIGTQLNSFLDYMTKQQSNNSEVGYLFSCDLSIPSNKTFISDSAFYLDLTEKIRNNQDQYILVLRSTSTAYYLYYISRENYPYFGLVGNTLVGTYIYKTNPYDLLNVENINNKYSQIDTYNTRNKTWTTESGNNLGLPGYIGGMLYPTSLAPFETYSIMAVTYGQTEGYKWYKSASNINASNVIYSEYYYNKPIYNNWHQSNGNSYTFDNSNTNKVTYGDITNYIDNEYHETGDYPTLPDIEHWIQDQPIIQPTPTPTPDPENPNNGGNGGSGGSATATANNEGINITINNNHNLNIGGSSVSGNGLNGGTVSGNGGSGGDFFGWLGRVGDVIGNLIKGIGEALTGIFEGVAEAVTTIMESIPNILSPLFEFIFGGLPEEIKSLMTLGITCVIFIGVIKAIKR